MELNSSPSSHEARRRWLAALLLRQPSALTARLTAGLARLRAMPRGYRRRLQQRAAVTVAGAALILGMAGSALLAPPVHAATITVDGVTCTLANAIRSANTGAGVGGCATGSVGLDTIELETNTTLAAIAGFYYASNTGLPLITDDLIIEGNGYAIQRDMTGPEFRIMAVADGVELTLRDTTISGGHSGRDGGGIYMHSGTLTLDGITVHDNYAYYTGGGVSQSDGNLLITDSLFSDNRAYYDGGGLFFDNFYLSTSEATIRDSTFTGNEAAEGGAIYLDGGLMRIIDTIISGNYAYSEGGGIYQDGDPLELERVVLDDNEAGNIGGAIFADGPLTLTYSVISNNRAQDGGGITIADAGSADITNSTFSGNSAYNHGGAIRVHNAYSSDTKPSTKIAHSTITGNMAGGRGAGIFIEPSYSSYSYVAQVELANSILSGNTATSDGDELHDSGGGVSTSAYNILSDNDKTTAQAFTGFAPAANDFDASSDADDVAIEAILDTTLADNGGPTMTHALVSGSPAIDSVPASDTDLDQRGYGRPFGAAFDAGAYEYGAGGTAVFMSTKTSGKVDGLSFDNSDILKWDGAAWTKFFDGTDAHLDPNNKPKHNVNAFSVDGDEIIMSFAQNGRKVNGLTGKVDGMDLVRWDGSGFSLWFDGSDVGLTKKTPEKIDALHVLPGDAAPPEFGGGCEFYLLVSTQGAGAVPAYGGGQIKFGGEDILGFCLTNWGEATDGFWHLVFDGSVEGLPKNSLDSISVDGDTLFFTTSKVINLGGGVGGGHSTIYAYNRDTGDFSGPLFIASQNGLTQKVDGLDVSGHLP